MKRVTVSIDDDVYHRAHAKAIERNTSVSALVKQILVELAKEGAEPDRMKREEAALRASIRTFRASDRLSRDDVHDRSR